MISMFSGYTETELLKFMNDFKNEHEKLKNEIIQYSHQIDDIEKIINNKLSELDDIELNYKILTEELNSR